MLSKVGAKVTKAGFALSYKEGTHGDTEDDATFQEVGNCLISFLLQNAEVPGHNAQLLAWAAKLTAKANSTPPIDSFMNSGPEVEGADFQRDVREFIESAVGEENVQDGRVLDS
jgi:hypothetical protein